MIIATAVSTTYPSERMAVTIKMMNMNLSLEGGYRKLLWHPQVLSQPYICYHFWKIWDIQDRVTVFLGLFLENQT